MRLTDEKEALFRKAFENDMVLEMNDAFRIYSSRGAAKQAVQSLEAQGFVERKDYGEFEIVELPEELEHLKDRSYGPRDFLGVILDRVKQRIV